MLGFTSDMLRPEVGEQMLLWRRGSMAGCCLQEGSVVVVMVVVVVAPLRSSVAASYKLLDTFQGYSIPVLASTLAGWLHRESRNQCQRWGRYGQDRGP